MKPCMVFKLFSLLLLVALASCNEEKPLSIGTTHIAYGKTDDLWLIDEAVKYCPMASETPCQVLFLREGTSRPSSIPLSDKQVKDVLMYFAVDNSLDSDVHQLDWNCDIFPPFNEFTASCITPQSLNNLLTPYHPK